MGVSPFTCPPPARSSTTTTTTNPFKRHRKSLIAIVIISELLNEQNWPQIKRFCNSQSKEKGEEKMSLNLTLSNKL